MGEYGKRNRQQNNNHEDDKHRKRRATDKENDRDELVVYRILCPGSVIGSVIGKSGSIINAIRHGTRAKVKVVDPFPGAKDRVITIYCYIKEKHEVEPDEEFDDREPLCPAQDALLKVHGAIINAVASVEDSDSKSGDKVECQLLVPSSQAATIIGKSGANIKNMRSKTRTNIKVNPKDSHDPTHSCALDFDNFVQITGDPESVRKALFAVSAIMYKFSPKEDIPLETSVPEAPPSIIIPSDVPIFPGLYPSVDPIISSRSVPSLLGSVHSSDIPTYADTGSAWPIYSSALPVVSGYGGSSQSEELTVRLLCPSRHIGRVIGKGGSSIRGVRQASGARIEVDDKSDRDDCVITVISREAVDDLKSMAVEAVLLLQGKINDEDDDTVSMRLLVPSKVIGCIIGKSGSIVNEIRKRTKADIRISKGEKPKCAGANDEFIEVTGEVGSVRDALIQIVLRLRDDVLRDHKEVGRNSSTVTESLYPGGTGLSVPSLLPTMPPTTSLGYEQRPETGSGLGMLSSNRLYGYESLPKEDNGYGSLSSYSSNLYGGLPPSSTVELLIPAHALGKVVGKGGANLENIRKISGAVIEIVDSKLSRGDRVALVSGTSEQKRAAENLIQAFIMSA